MFVSTIRVGAEAELDVARLVHVTPGSRWACAWSHAGRTIEVLIDGDATGPSGPLLGLAREALACLGELERVADGYLRGFVDPRALGIAGRWMVKALVVAWPRPSRRPVREVEVGLAAQGDEYGDWAVRFFRDEGPPAELRPHVFSRRQR